MQNKFLSILMGLICFGLCSGFAQKPILLQGQVQAQDVAESSWYNSRDPDALYSQIQILEKTVRDLRREVKNQSTELKTAKKENDLLQETVAARDKSISTLREKLSKAKKWGKKTPKTISSISTDPGVADPLTEAQERISELEKQLEERTPETIDPNPALEAELENLRTELATQRLNQTLTREDPIEVKELKALVRTYERTIASLEEELQIATNPEVIETIPSEARPNPDAIKENEVAEPSLPDADDPALDDGELEVSPPVEEAPAPIVAESAPAATLTEPAPEIERNADEWVDEANRLLQRGNIEAAQEAFKAALDLDPFSLRAQLGQASVDYALDDLERAQMKVTSILAMEPKNPQAMGLQGIILWRKGQIRQAEAMLREALAIDNQDAQLYNYYAIIEHAKGRYSEAAEALATAIELNPEHPEAHFNLAVIQVIGPVPDIQKAQKLYEKAILLGSQRDPKFEQALYQE